MNVSCGDKMIGCAALSAAFINGIKAFGTDEKGSPLLMPILKLSYNEIISESKIKILKATDEADISKALNSSSRYPDMVNLY